MYMLNLHYIASASRNNRDNLKDSLKDTRDKKDKLKPNSKYLLWTTIVKTSDQGQHTRESH